jgi:membrane fusion protein (multidrug efflux system)
MKTYGRRLLAAALVALVAGCSGDDSGGEPGGRGGGGRPAFGGGGPSIAAVPVEVTTVARQTISSFIETNGTLEAEVEVDLVARVSAPIVALDVEEGDVVRKGQRLALLDDVELRVMAELSRVSVAETQQSFDRAEQLHGEGLIAPEEYERAVSAYDSARAQFEASQIQLQFTELRAPFSGRIVRRYVDPAQQVSVNTPIFRLSDFDPLLCPIQIPERDLPRVRLNQSAWLSVEAAPGERFPARVLRISPIVEATTGTIKVTLEIRDAERLRPGMFARVYVETETRDDALVIPKAALSLESIGDTVYVAANGQASRREVELGFRQGDLVEIVSGVDAGEQVVIVGQDGLSDGTPLQILSGSGDAMAEATDEASSTQPPAPGDERPTPGSSKGGRGGRPDFANMTDEQLEQVKERMRSRGMSDEQIDERIKRSREAATNGE